jgi:hypothetical protein
MESAFDSPEGWAATALHEIGCVASVLLDRAHCAGRA